MEEYKLGDKDLNDDKLPLIYKKGFEHGYWLCRGGSQELENVINDSKNHKDYHGGLKAGKKEAEREKIRERMKRNRQQPRDQDRGIDID